MSIGGDIVILVLGFLNSKITPKTELCMGVWRGQGWGRRFAERKSINYPFLMCFGFCRFCYLKVGCLVLNHFQWKSSKQLILRLDQWTFIFKICNTPHIGHFPRMEVDHQL